MAQTAVDYIFKKLDVLFTLTPQTTVTGTKEEWENLYNQAKAMEKEQIVKALERGFDEGCKFPEDITLKNAEQYYQQTYNK
jgi:hypothetical protein